MTARALILAAAIAVLPAAAPPSADWRAQLGADELELAGFAGGEAGSDRPTLIAYVRRESYRPGDIAQLVITDSAAQVNLRIFRAGTTWRPIGADQMEGSPVSRPVRIGGVQGRRLVRLRLGDWPSGVYFVRLAAGPRVGYAPFVLRPERLGEHRIAIVLPTQTWQAYNFRDDDGDRVPDTWYVDGTTARLARAFLNRGVPPHWRNYDRPFVRWAQRTGHVADYLADSDLDAARNGDELRRAYELIIFEGHHEYVTKHEYDVVKRFRDLGGNLAFLSANNFYWKITIRNDVMTRVAKWRDLGRPEAGLIGVQYFHNDEGEHRGRWVVQRTATSLPWLFAGSGLRPGDRLGSGGIEADAVVTASPRGVRVVAVIPNLFGDDRDAQMTYYETTAGAKVFAAGAFTLAGSVDQPDVGAVVADLWKRLSKD